MKINFRDNVLKINNLSITIKLPLILFLSFVMLVLIAGYQIWNLSRDSIRRTVEGQVSDKSALIENLIIEFEEESLKVSSLAAAMKSVKEAYGNPDIEEGRKELEKAVMPLVKNIESNLGMNELRLHFHKNPAVSFLRVWTDKWGDDLSGFRKTILKVRETGKPLMAVELGRGGIAIRGIAPVIDNGEYLGSVELYTNPFEIIPLLESKGEKSGLVLLTSRKMAEELFFEQDLSKYFKGEIGEYLISGISADWVNPDTMLSAESLSAADSPGGTTVEIKGNTAAAYIPLIDFSGRKVGYIAYVRDITEYNNLIIKDLMNTAVRFSMVAVVLIFIIFIMIRGVIVTPVVRQASILKDISEGEGDLTRLVDIRSSDEIGRLGLYFNNFTEKLKNIIKKIKVQSLKNVEIKEKLNETAAETAVSVNQITSNVSSITGSIQKLDDNIGEVTSAIEEVAANINSLDQQIQKQSDMVDHSKDSILEMISSIKNVAGITEERWEAAKKLIDTSADGKQKLNTTIENFNTGVVARIESIQEMTLMISSIASQTNLLSMNAAIEAAHAGSYGRGFAVVADEIGKLAEGVSDQSSSISRIITEITEAIALTSDSVSSTSDAFNEIEREVHSVTEAFSEIKNSANELQQGSLEIQNVMNSLKDISSNVRQGADEMNHGIRDMSTSMMDVHRISSEVRTGMQEVQEGANEVLNATGKVSTLSSTMNEIGQNIDDEVNKFKTE